MVVPVTVQVFRNPIVVVGTPEWFASSTKWIRNTLKSVNGDCRPIAHKAPELRKYVTETLGRDWDDFCAKELDTKAGWVEAIERGVAILEASGHAGTITKQAIAELVATTPAAGSHGGTTERVDNVNLAPPSGSGGNSRSYRIARLKRDRPDLAAGLANGVFNSVAEAWRAAGFEKPKDPERTMHKAIAKALPAEPPPMRGILKDVIAPVREALRALKGQERTALAYELIRVAEEALRETKVKK